MEYQKAAMRTDSEYGAVRDKVGSSYKILRLLHAQLGIASEAGEIADCLKKHLIYGQPLDMANLKEECGDLLWYINLLLKALGFDIEDAMIDNIAKLKLRYPNKFTEKAAAERADKINTLPFGRKVCGCIQGVDCGCEEELYKGKQ